MIKKLNLQYLDRPLNLSAVSVSPTELNVSFTTEMRLWRPSQFKIEYCHQKSLSRAALPLSGGPCRNVSANATSASPEQSVALYELISFSEYQITVFGLLDGFDERGATSAYVNTRTLPENDIEWIVTEDGQFRMSWLKKVAAYDEDARVTLWLEKLLPNGSVVCALVYLIYPVM